MSVLHAGMVSAPYVTVDDTGACHAHDNFYTTQIGGEHFAVFRTTASKSRLNFLSLLCGSYHDYVLNDAAFDYLQGHPSSVAMTARLRAPEPMRFCNQVPFLEYLAGQGVDIFDKAAVRILGEAATWGSIHHHGLVGDTVIISDDAGQFRIGNHALCWVHAERLLQKLMPVKPKHAKSVAKAVTRGCQRIPPKVRQDFYPTHRHAEHDALLARLHRRKHELLRVLDWPTIPLHTNASENDLRSFVTKRKISGGTVSRDGRVARDTMLGLMKTCRSLGFLSITTSATGSAFAVRSSRRLPTLSLRKPNGAPPGK
nr:transposase [Rhizobium grahamii]